LTLNYRVAWPAQLRAQHKLPNATRTERYLQSCWSLLFAVGKAINMLITSLHCFFSSRDVKYLTVAVQVKFCNQQWCA